MDQPPSRPQAGLSHLVGPGPAGDAESPALSVGLCNPGQAVALVHLELELAQGSAAPLVAGEWSGLLARRSERVLQARIDWSRRELVLEERRFAFAGDARPRPGSALVARAHVRGAARGADVLEVGLRARSDAQGA